MPIERIVIAQDVMTTMVEERLALPCSASELDSFFNDSCSNRTAADSLRKLMDVMAEWLLKLGYPDLRGKSVHHRGGRFWCYISQDEMDHGGFRFSWASAYVEEVSRVFSHEWYAARIYHYAWLTLNDYEANRWDGLFHCAFALGRLIEEYEMRRRHLKTITAKHEHDAKNREHGAKGGQAEKKRERYRALDMLAREKLRSFLLATDLQAFRKAKELAAKHDKEAAEPLFMQGGKPLSRAWFDEWLAHFRQQARQDIDSA